MMKTRIEKLRDRLAINSAKLVHKLLQGTGLGMGSSWPGRVAGLLSPGILGKLSAAVREKTFVTLGTNGKTTSNNLICRALEDSGKKVICNRLGANMQNGIVSSYVLAAEADGSLDADYACIEVDELAAADVFPQLRPDYILLTNIFRDQLDRYGEIDIVCEKIKSAVNLVPEAVLIVNGDDIFSYGLASGCANPKVIYGINEDAFSDENPARIRDSLFCRFCGHRLTYRFFHYAHLGIWHCPGCGASRPLPSYTANDISFHTEGVSFSLKGTPPINAGVRAAYSVYNILSSYAALCAAGVPTEGFAETVRHFDFGNSREEAYRIEEARAQLYLIKNPIGLQQKLSLLQKDPAPKDIILLINDNDQDGRDVSWLWDVDFGCLGAVRAASITAAGLRRYDVELRLKYEEIPCKTTGSLETSVKELIKEGTGNLYLLVNYSGLYRTKRLLDKLQKKGGAR